MHCLRASGGTTANILKCDTDEQKYQDRRLNAVYQRLLATQSEGKQEHTRQIERAWLKNREDTCSTQQQQTGGTMDSINSNSCFLEQTKMQADTLQNQLNHPPS